ncbi:MAG: HEAT repeat domain-containing protein [Cyclobacteriaceae bacterium]|nr:HEAT repeat domain-containing protein [Cyclobacteriaceae bacterium]
MENKRSLFSRLLDLQEGEEGRVALLLIMSFFMGAFLATFTVAAQTLFLNNFSEQDDLPGAFAVAGAFGMVATLAYNFLQRKVSFRFLAILSLVVITLVTASIEFGDYILKDKDTIYYYGFTQLVPFTLIILLVFWGAFNRFFNVRQSKRLLGTVDQGALVASLISFFAIPIVLPLLPGETEADQVESLYSISLVSIVIFTILFIFLSVKFGGEQWSLKKEKTENVKVSIAAFLKNRYLIILSVFVIISITALNFVEYSFLSVSTNRFKPEELATFLALFEATIVIFSFLFDVFASERILQDYGLRVAILVNPILIGLFTVAALIIGVSFGYTPDSPSFTIFFVMIAMSMLFINATKEALDEPAFKLYELPVEANIKIDVQTKVEGVVTGFATMLAGGIIYLINKVQAFDFLYITLFTLPIVGLWYFIGNTMHTNYRKTLRKTLIDNKSKINHNVEQEYTVDRVLEKEVKGSVEDKVLYGLRLMEKIEPALFENVILGLADSNLQKVKAFAHERIQNLGLEKNSDISRLAVKAQGAAEDTDLLSIQPDKLVRLSKSVKPSDRMLAAKLLRNLISQRTIFILLELLRDADYKVRHEALITARKVKRPETWPTLIELLSSPSYCHQATAALIEAGEPTLNVLDTAFHKSGQSDLVMLRIVQIVGRIGGQQALDLLWKKADYPDKRIVKQILYSLRYINYQASGRQAREVMDLLEAEISKSIWNQTALHELPQTEHFQLLRNALREEIRMNNNQITLLLSILYDPEAVQLVRENIESGDPNGIAYAIELLDLFIDQDLKPKLFPLIDDIPVPRKLELLQVYFPRENYNPIQVINYILNRDFNLNNRWTKVCAAYTSAYIPDFRTSRGLIAQMFNRDKLLQETAAWVIYNKDKNVYDTISERLPARDKRYLDSSIENNQLLDGLNDGFFLGIEIIMFLKQLPEFRNISGVLLADLFDRIIAYDLSKDEKISLNPSDQNSPILIVAHGEVHLKENGETKITLTPGHVYGDLFSINSQGYKLNSIEATIRSVVFSINLMDFYFVMANHHEMVEKFIHNVTTKHELTT